MTGQNSPDNLAAPERPNASKALVSATGTNPATAPSRQPPKPKFSSDFATAHSPEGRARSAHLALVIGTDCEDGSGRTANRWRGQLLARILRRAGFAVREVADAHESLAQVRLPTPSGGADRDQERWWAPSVMAIELQRDERAAAAAVQAWVRREGCRRRVPVLLVVPPERAEMVASEMLEWPDAPDVLMRWPPKPNRTTMVVDGLIERFGAGGMDWMEVEESDRLDIGVEWAES